MATYTVHFPPTSGGAPPPPDKIVFLRDDGFSWFAFLFGPLWLLWRRAWLAAGLWTLTLLAVYVVASLLRLPQESLFWLGIAMGVLLGFEGSNLLAWSLARRGYAEKALVLGDSEDEAEESFFNDWRPAAPPPPPPPLGDERPAA